MFRNYRKPLLLSFCYLHGSLFASSPDQTGLNDHSAQYLLYQSYDDKARYTLKLSYDPASMGLCLQRMGSGNNGSNHFITLPEPVIAIDVAVTTGQQIIVVGKKVAGKKQNRVSFLQAVDYTGKLLWRYPSPARTSNDYLQFYDLALSKNKTALFAAGSADGQSRLWRFSLSDSGISHIQELFTTADSAVPGSYRQVITHSGNEAIAVLQPDQDDLPTRLEKWYRQDDQWLRIPDFCPQLSLHNAVSTALKTEQSGKRFFFIVSQHEQIRFFQIDMLTGNLLNQLTIESLLQWDYTARVTTPALLSASTALRQESTAQLSLFQQQVTHLYHNLVNRPVLALINRGCLLGISSSFARAAPLVINLCPKREGQEGKILSSSTEGTNLWGVTLSFRHIIKSILLASGILGLPVLCMQGLQLLWSVLPIRLPPEAPPEEGQKDKLRRKRLEHFTSKSPCMPEDHSSRFYSPSGESLLLDVPLKNKQPVFAAEREKILQLLLLTVINETAENKAKVTEKSTVTRNMLSKALARVKPPKSGNPAKSEHNSIPDGLTLRSMPADHFCFYHAIGQAIDVSGPELFNIIVQQAQALLQNAQAFSETVDNMGGSEILAEIAAMGHVDAADLQIWGDQQMLPFICSILKFPIVMLTPAAWHREAGGLLFLPDGSWEMLNGNAESLLTQLRELQNEWPDLLLIQHNAHDHWDVLEWAEGQ